jgi:hypothetical protein
MQASMNQFIGRPDTVATMVEMQSMFNQQGMNPFIIDRVGPDTYAYSFPIRGGYSNSNILYSRKEAAKRNPRFLANDIRHSYKHSRMVLEEFDLLGREDPSLRPPSAFTFYTSRGIARLHILGRPSITMIKGAGNSISITEILPTNHPRTEKLKRLFMRHLGFNCTRWGKNIRIKYPSGDWITFPMAEGFMFQRGDRRAIIGVVRR